MGEAIALDDRERFEREMWVEVWGRGWRGCLAVITSGRRRRLRADNLEGDGDRPAEELGHGATDESAHAGTEPLDGKIGGGANDEGVAVETKAHGVAEPGVEVRAADLELELAEGSLPESSC